MDLTLFVLYSDDWRMSKVGLSLVWINRNGLTVSRSLLVLPLGYREVGILVGQNHRYEES